MQDLAAPSTPMKNPTLKPCLTSVARVARVQNSVRQVVRVEPEKSEIIKCAYIHLNDDYRKSPLCGSCRTLWRPVLASARSSKSRRHGFRNHWFQVVLLRVTSRQEGLTNPW